MIEHLFTSAGLIALGTVILIDLVMSGDNAVIIGMAASGLEPKLRRKAILIGIAAAALLRAGFAAVAVQLLDIIGLTLAGGILLLWVAWKMWREYRAMRARQKAEALHRTTAGAEAAPAADPYLPLTSPKKTLRAALVSIIVADVSMSLDNVLAVAGAAKENLIVLGIGLALSIALMALAANYIARLMDRVHWLAFVGLLIVLYVAIDMIYRGAVEVGEAAIALSAMQALGV